MGSEEDKRTEAQKERDWKLVKSQMDFLFEAFESDVKKWIYEQWPHGYGLYD